MKIKQEKGITLVALIITIIVLVILAAVTINAAFNSGIIDTAVNGAVNYADAQRQEQVTFDELDGSLQDILNRINEYDIGGGNRPGTKPTDDPEVESTPIPKPTPDLTKVTFETSADNIEVPVPKGFMISEVESEQTVEKGLVIKDSIGNEFVWVPVADTSTMFTTYKGSDVGQLYNFDGTAKTYSPITYSSTSYHEPDIVTGTGSQYDADTSNYASLGLKNKAGETVTTASQFESLIKEDFSEMKESVETYGGFYIGRYETGVIGVVKKGIAPLNNQNWYNQYQTNKEIVNSNGIKSSMIWGCQWDQVLIWFDSQGGNNKTYVYNGSGKGYFNPISITSTGSNIAYAVNNIYDMTGNVCDWTIEAYDTGFRVGRGRRCWFTQWISRLSEEWFLSNE